MKSLYGETGNRMVSIYVKSGEALVNDTQEEYEVHHAYDTVANGRADRIAIQPGEVAWLRSKGGASDFARWDIGTPEELPTGTKTYNVSRFK